MWPELVTRCTIPVGISLIVNTGVTRILTCCVHLNLNVSYSSARRYWCKRSEKKRGDLDGGVDKNGVTMLSARTRHRQRLSTHSQFSEQTLICKDVKPERSWHFQKEWYVVRGYVQLQMRTISLRSSAVSVQCFATALPCCRFRLTFLLTYVRVYIW